MVTSQGLPRGLFSSDGRRYAFLDRPIDDAAALAAYDFDSDESVTLAPVTHAGIVSDEAAFLADSGLVFRTYAPNAPVSNDPTPLFVHDFQTGTTRGLGDALELTAIPGGTSAAFRTDGGPAMFIDATLAPRALPGSSIAAGPDIGYAGFQPTSDGKRLAYADGDRVFHLVGLDGGPDLTLSGMSEYLPDYCEHQWPPESNLPNPPRAAKFTRDGRAFVRALGAAPFSGNGIYALGRYDLTTGQESVLSLPEPGSLMAFSPLGQVLVQEGLPPLHLWSWPLSLLALEIPDADPNYVTPPVDASYSFTDDGQYFTYTAGAFLMRHDIAAGTTRNLAPIDVMGVVAISSATGVAVVWVDHHQDGAALTAFAPDGSSLTLDPLNDRVLAEPRGTGIAYPISDEAGDGIAIYRLQNGATPMLVGSGWLLAVSETQVIFRDLDGVCSSTYSW